MIIKKSRGRGSVGKSFRYYDKLKRDSTYQARRKELCKKSQLKRKKKINKRCIDCGVLISPVALRCAHCNRKNFWSNKRDKK